MLKISSIVFIHTIIRRANPNIIRSCIVYFIYVSIIEAFNFRK